MTQSHSLEYLHPPVKIYLENDQKSTFGLPIWSPNYFYFLQIVAQHCKGPEYS